MPDRTLFNPIFIVSLCLLLSRRFLKNSRHIIFSVTGVIITAKLIMFLSNIFDQNNIFLVLIPTALLFFSVGAAYPIMSGKAYASIKNYAGIGVALFGTILMLISSIGTGIAASLPHASIIPFSAFALCISIIIVVTLFFLKKKL